MRALRFLNVAVLSVLVGSAALVCAQEEKQEDKPAKQEEAKPQPKQEEAKPSRPEDAKPAKQDNKQMDKQDPKRGQDTSREEAKPQGQEHPEMKNDHAQPAQERPEVQNDRNRQGQEMQGNKGGQAAGRGSRIPDDKFRAQFGREHHFNARSVIVQGRPQFQYGGYNFQLVDAWPSDWAYTDDCYIDYIDGEYYLIDLVHPGIRLAVFVAM